MKHASAALSADGFFDRLFASRLFILGGKLFLLLSLAAALYIMANGIGLADSLDFGAGAYYYADIPNFQRFMDASSYRSEVSFTTLTALFLLWGAIMYQCWKRLL